MNKALYRNNFIKMRRFFLSQKASCVLSGRRIAGDIFMELEGVEKRFDGGSQ